MSEKQRDLTSEKVQKGAPRPVLLVSEHTLYEYSLYLKRLLIGLADESIPAALVCPPNIDIDYLIAGSVEIIRYPALQLPFMGRLNRDTLFRQVVKFEPTVLYCLCEGKSLLTRQLARKLDLPYILMVNSLHKRWGRLRISSKRCSKIIVPAKSIADDLAKVHPRLAERIEHINIGTFVGKHCECFNKLSRLACLVIAHPLDNADDFENLFSAVRQLVINGYEFMVVVTGDGRDERQLRKLLTALGLSQFVTIIPRLRPWWVVLAAGDIFIQPQPSDTFNPLLLEAMSIGSAVAGCKGGVDDLIIEDKTAVVFNPDDELSIYGCLKKLLDRPEFARQIAKGAQQYLKQNHSVSNMISATLRAFHDAQQ